MHEHAKSAWLVVHLFNFLTKIRQFEQPWNYVWLPVEMLETSFSHPWALSPTPQTSSLDKTSLNAHLWVINREFSQVRI